MGGFCPGVPGDIVAVQRNHCVHYVVNVGGNFIIHKTNPKIDRVGGSTAGDQNGAEIVKEVFSAYARPGEIWYVDNMCDREFSPLPPAEIVSRAHSKLGEKGYSLVRENCEHFATWCRYNRAVSRQVDKALSTIASDAGNGAATKGAAYGAAGGRYGASIGSGAGRLLGEVIGAVADRCEADDAARKGIVPSGRSRQTEWAETGRSLGQKGVGVIGAVGGAAVGGIVGLIGGGAQGVAKVADKHNITKANAPGLAAKVVRASE